MAALQLPNVVIKDALRFAQDQLSPIIGAQRRLRNANESSGRSLRPKRPALSFEELLLAASGDGGGDGGEMVASIEDSRSGGGGGFFSSLFSSRGRKEASASSSSPMCIGGIASRSVSGRELLAAAREMADLEAVAERSVLSPVESVASPAALKAESTVELRVASDQSRRFRPH